MDVDEQPRAIGAERGQRGDGHRGELGSYLTPTELFHIRSHFPTPVLERAAYRLRTCPRMTTETAVQLDRGPLIDC